MDVTPPSFYRLASEETKIMKAAQAFIKKQLGGAGPPMYLYLCIYEAAF